MVLRSKDDRTKLAREDFEAGLLDIRRPGMYGMDVIREIWLNHSNDVTIMITAIDDVDTAVKAMKLGASDYIVKPFDLDRVATSIRTALETKPADKFSAEMDAIARGVETKLDPFYAYAKVVTQRTIDVARQLDIVEEKIERWEAGKAIPDSKRKGTAKGLKV